MFGKLREKLNQAFKHRRAVIAGTSCLAIATCLVLSMLSMDGIDTQAAGYVEADTTSDFWKEVIIPPGKIWQELKVTPKLKSKGSQAQNIYRADSSETDPTYYKTVIPLDYARNDEFSLKIDSNELKAENAAWGTNLHGTNTDITWNVADTPWKFDYIPNGRMEQKTYYRLVMEGSSLKNWGDELFQAYQTQYKNDPDYDQSSFTTTRDTLGTEFISFAENFLTKNGFLLYNSQSAIPLTQNGQVLTGVEMVTFTTKDLYYWVRSDEEEKREDLDILLYTTHNYEFQYGKKAITLEAPTAKRENGDTIATDTKLSKDDRILLGHNASMLAYQDEINIQYCLSDTKLGTPSAIRSWSVYDPGSVIDPGGKKYLYVRTIGKSESGPYIESNITEYSLNYLPSSTAFVTADPVSGNSLDVEDQLTLNSASKAPIYYVAHVSTEPTLTKIASTEYAKFSGQSGYAKLNGEVYIQLNGLWYHCSDSSLQKYTGAFGAGDQLRINNTMIVYVLVAEEGAELGSFQRFQYSYASSKQAAPPQASVKTSEDDPTTIKMGSSIELTCSTEGSQIFYTTNGSAPVITQDSGTGQPIAGAGTMEYDPTEPIVVSEENANYGKTFRIMAQAVTYKEIGGSYYRVNQDSSVAKYSYSVADQSVVEAVQSIPKTDTETPLEVAVGSRIQLYSQTDHVTIYYTLDGSEPTFDENGPTSAATKVYSGNEGVLVEKMENSSLFTITAVAYKNGLAVSDISRLVFAYPGAVSSPYANPLPGAVEDNTEVTLETATKDAIIYYEIGRGNEVPKEPTTSSRVFDAASPIVITEKTTIKAYAVKDSMESSVVTLEYTVTDQLNVPKPSIETGAVVASGTVISLSADSGTTIYYTLDGSDPKDEENKKVQVGSQVIINGKSGDLILLRTYAAKQGFGSSEEGTYSYSVSAYSGGIYADRENGSTLRNGDVVYLHTDMTEADIYYTLDGSAPTTDSHKGSSVSVYGEPGEQVTIMAMAVADGSEKTTSFATFTYTIMEKVAAPTSSVPDGAIFTKQSAVELQAETGKIYYTTDGTEPSVGSNLYKKNIVITEEVTIRAIAVAEDLETSEISTFHYGFAEQVAAPIASYASGELEMGTKVAFTTTTEGATIYYRTDGKDINLSKKNELEIYTEPLTIDQATNFRVIAVKDQMQDSNVLKVGYTVKEPVVIEAAEEEETQKTENQSSRLQSRRSFSDTESGPAFQDVVLKNAGYGAVVAAEEGVLPEQVQLKVEAANVTEAVSRRVKQVISESYGVVAGYDVTLLADGEEIQPDGTIEIGLPIPVEYENAMIYIVHVQEDGNIELYETRRSGGVAYAKVDHLSVYAITAPVEFEEEKASFPWLPVMYTIAVGLTGAGCFMIYRAKKEKREDGM